MKRFLALALTVAVLASVMMVPQVQAAGYTAPEYKDVIATVELVNDYWISEHKNSVGSSFWERGAYNTGNMEAYALTGIEEYRDYSVKWASANRWMGNYNQGDKNRWTWGYTGDQNGTGALFGDWQTCFHTYADLYVFDEVKDPKKIARAREVMEYQMSKSEDGFWWWADGLYMVMPAMVKLHNITGNDLYLDKLYEYYKFARELMYDGPGGIPTSAEGYTTSASLKGGAQYSDPATYTGLFYRDAEYVYPKNPIPGSETTKNFWARGNGWVFAALAKVLQDTPDNWEHRKDFMDAFVGMAKALKACQKFDDDGNGFWTQSVLAHNYSCSNENPLGYETSGTAFFTYGFLWGINAGILDENEYKDTAIAGWNYLTKVALHENGRVGYVQPVGARAGSAATKNNTQDFAVGATLLAGCEMARYVGGMQGYFYPYLQRRMSGMVGLKINSPYAFTEGNVKPVDAAPVIVNDRTLVPVRVISEGVGCEVNWDGATQTVTITKGATEIAVKIGAASMVVDGVSVPLDAPASLINDRTMVPLRAIAEALGKIVYYNDNYKMIIVGYKNDVFMDCEEAMEKMLSDTLATGVRPEKNPVFKDLCGLPAELKDKALIKPVSATATHEPESFNGIHMSVDMNTETRWGSDKEAELTVDFGEVKYMEKLGLCIWRGSSGLRSTTFDLYVSADGVNFEKIFSGDSLNTAEWNILDCGKDVRYVKFHGYKNSENNWVNVFEVVGYGKGVQLETTLK
ncbi:MAG: glycoside hydrolase family 88 protein [Clostridia bacterium]|nr:glycoside hydrolase family 88 protein [Clostridia bacterium]